MSFKDNEAIQEAEENEKAAQIDVKEAYKMIRVKEKERKIALEEKDEEVNGAHRNLKAAKARRKAATQTKLALKGIDPVPKVRNQNEAFYSN